VLGRSLRKSDSPFCVWIENELMGEKADYWNRQLWTNSLSILTQETKVCGYRKEVDFPGKISYSESTKLRGKKTILR